MKNNYSATSFFPIAIFYLILSIALWWFRAPNVDEPWMGGIAVSLDRYGAFFDLGWLRSGQWKIFFFGESYYTCLFLWMKIFGNNLMTARIMSVIMGLSSLFIIHKILNKKINPQLLFTILLLLGGNYYFLLANTQIRSESWCLLAVMLSLQQMYYWIKNSKKQNLFFAHLFLILATLGHFQAAFVGLAAWVFTFLIFKKDKKYTWLPFLTPYIITAIIYFRYLYINKEDFLEWFGFYFGREGDMVGHAGGMIGSAYKRLSNGAWEESILIIILIILFGVGNITTLFYNRKSSLFVLIGLYGMGAYLSWLLTTTHVNDYHAVWLIFSFLSILTLTRTNSFTRLIYYGNLIILIGLLLWGAQWTYSVININPRADYEEDIEYINSALKEDIKTIHCPRDIMWDFNFEEATFDPKYYTNNTADIIVRRKFKNPTDLISYQKYEGNRFIIFVKK